jgi:anti-sigma regulatory factor (Ser/Thr protein kinase)
VDSVGLRTIVDLQRRAHQRGLSLQVISPPEDVRAVFRLSRADAQLRFAGQRAELAPQREYAERVALELAVSERAPGLAREEVREAVAGKLAPHESELAVLLISELVTNAVVHPGERNRDGDSIGLRIGTDSGRARIEVADSGPGFDPTALKRQERTVGGHGLVLVDRSAVRWGMRRDDRFRIWFEI